MKKRSGNTDSKIPGLIGRRLLFALNSTIIATLISAAPVHASLVSFHTDRINPLADGAGHLNVTNDDGGTTREFNFNNVISDKDSHKSGDIDQDPAAKGWNDHDFLESLHGGTHDDGGSNTIPRDDDHGAFSSSDGDFKFERDERGHHRRDDFGKDGDHCHNPAPVPVPAAAWLLGSGLLGLASVARRKAKPNLK